jgi:hypothetical protein
MITIFAFPKPFTGYTEIIQRNALKSWSMLRPRPEIILFGDEPGEAEVAAELGLIHIPEVAVNEFGTPLLSDFFATADRVASHDLLAYVNADIILLQDFIEAVRSVYLRKRYLMVARRWDLDVEGTIDFDDPNCERELREEVRERAKLHWERGMDVFIFPRGLYNGMPPFAIGRLIYDNWFVYRAKSMRVPVIDATDAMVTIHQNHDYSHHKQGESGVRSGPEAQRNKELAGPAAHLYDVRDANWRLTGEGLKRRWPAAKDLRWRLDRVAVEHPHTAPVVKAIVKMGERVKKILHMKR